MQTSILNDVCDNYVCMHSCVNGLVYSYVTVRRSFHDLQSYTYLMAIYTNAVLVNINSCTSKWINTLSSYIVLVLANDTKQLMIRSSK